MSKKMSQKEKVLQYLKKHKRGLTPLDALELFHCNRLSARIKELRKDGYDIVTDREDGRTEDGDYFWYGRYRLRS